MSNLQTREVLDSAAVIDRDVSQDLYTYDAAVREQPTAAPHALGTLAFHPWLSEFTD